MPLERFDSPGAYQAFPEQDPSVLGAVPAAPRSGVGITTSLLSRRDFLPHPTVATEPRRDQTRSRLPDPHTWMLQSSPAPSLPPGSIRHLTTDFPLQKIKVFLLERSPHPGTPQPDSARSLPLGNTNPLWVNHGRSCGRTQPNLVQAPGPR